MELANAKFAHKDADGNTIEDQFLTYSEAERQDNEASKALVSRVYLPFTITIFTEVMHQHSLTFFEAMLHGFILHIIGYGKDGEFRMSTEKIMLLFGVGEDRVKSAVVKFKRAGLFRITTRVIQGKGRQRIIKKVNKNTSEGGKTTPSIGVKTPLIEGGETTPRIECTNELNAPMNGVANATPHARIMINSQPLEELTYVSEDEGRKKKSKYGRAVMATMIRKYCSLAGIELQGDFDASPMAKPLGDLYQYLGKDADKVMAYMEKAIGYFNGNKLSFNMGTLLKNVDDIDQLIAKAGKKAEAEDVYERMYNLLSSVSFNWKMGGMPHDKGWFEGIDLTMLREAVAHYPDDMFFITPEVTDACQNKYEEIKKHVAPYVKTNA